jgi:hypothetical protein
MIRKAGIGNNLIFIKDSDDPNPLIRALAIRTMGCLRVDKIIDYLTEPLRKCLKVECVLQPIKNVTIY